jgi:hypothetical protein
VDLLLGIFGARLLFPPSFVGRGDMSRGGLLLRGAREGKELDYAPIAGAVRHGPSAAEAPAPPAIGRAGERVTPPATRDRHPSRASARPARKAAPDLPGRLVIPRESNDVALDFGGRTVYLTNLNKVFWKELGRTKGDLLQYYADVSPYLLPHLKDRAMVMKRYPHGADGEFFFMKRAPSPRPDWIETCSIAHSSGNVIDFPMVQDLPPFSGSSTSAAST